MKSRIPIPRGQRAPLPVFTPVPRKSSRHDGWTPERQKAFIEALADTGSVSRACAQVNMSTEGAYYLRRQPGADEFRRAWEAALDYGVARMKDLAFERATEGTLVPVITGGKLIGWRRIYNDRLLMFCLRHYGEDANGKRTTVNYFSTRATSGAAASTPLPSREREGPAPQAWEGEGTSIAGRRTGREANPIDVTDSVRNGASASFAQASTAVVRTTIAHNADPQDLADSLGATAAKLDAFEGVALDDRAQAEIRAVLEACAARQRSIAGTAQDEAEPFIAALQPPRDMLVHEEGYGKPRKERRRPPPAYDLAVEPEQLLDATPHQFVPADEQHRSREEEVDWRMLDDEASMQMIEEAVSQIVRGTSQKRLGESIARRAQESDCEAITNQCEEATGRPPCRGHGGTEAASPGQPAAKRTGLTSRRERKAVRKHGESE